MKIFTSAIVLFIAIGLQAQEAAVSSGGDAIGTGGSSSYSVGQIVYTGQTGSNGSVAQGVQQAYEISVTVGIKETAIKLAISAFPNPTNNFLILDVSDYTSEKLTYQLYDVNGKSISKEYLTDTQTTIDMLDYPESTYLLSVQENNMTIKTFKIIKK